MAQKERATAAKSPLPNLVPEEFAQAGQKQVEAMIDMQQVIINAFEKMNRDWLAGAQGLARSATPELVPAHFGEPAQKPGPALIELQKELVASFENMNRDWADRVKAEMDVAAEFAARLTAARGIPDTAAVCQEWISRRMEMVFEDGRRLAAESQKFMTATARCFSIGWTSGSK